MVKRTNNTDLKIWRDCNSSVQTLSYQASPAFPVLNLTNSEIPQLMLSSEESLSPTELSLANLLKQYLSPEEIDKIWLAYRFSHEAHSEQVRKNGEPFISHPLAVASILAELHLDVPTLLAAFLHDVVEDTPIMIEEIISRFGGQVAHIVEGLSKLDKIQFVSQSEAQAENFRKMLLAMSDDVRVILVKLADRLHNMQTLDSMPPNRQKHIAKETLEIYAPIAHRLGLNKIFQLLEDLSFRYLYPYRFRVLSHTLQTLKGNHQEVIKKTVQAIETNLEQVNTQATVQGREKHLYGIYKKMRDKKLRFTQVHDIYGFRILVENRALCYLILGELHALYKPIPGKFKDYIALPKVNGYQSLHTTVFGPFSSAIELQIRTVAMHKIAEVGIAAHWHYKSERTQLSNLQQQTHQWLQRLLDIQAKNVNSIEFLEYLKIDLFPEEVYVFTPQGDIFTLPKKATAVDFAYAVHTNIGHTCISAKINHTVSPLNTILRSGDQVEIITAGNNHPNPEWLEFVVTSKARSHIREALKFLHRPETVSTGERQLNNILQILKLDTVAELHWDYVLKFYHLKTKAELLSDIGLGKRNGLITAYQLVFKKSSEEIILNNIDITKLNTKVLQLANCCLPIPGDLIMGLVMKESCLFLHRRNCDIALKNRKEAQEFSHFIWQKTLIERFQTKLVFLLQNNRGVLASIANVVSSAKADIENIQMEDVDEQNHVKLMVTINIEGRLWLAQLLRKLRLLKEVIWIKRNNTFQGRSLENLPK